MQSRYVESTLAGDEKIVYTGQVSLIQYGLSFLLGMYIFVVGIDVITRGDITGGRNVAEIVKVGTLLVGLGLFVIVRPFFIRFMGEFLYGIIFIIVYLVLLDRLEDAVTGENAIRTVWGWLFIGLGWLLMTRPFFIRFISEYVITSKRVVGKYGFIARQTFDLRLSKVENAQVKQGIFGRILGYGDILIGTAGGNTPIKGVKNPTEFHKKVVEIQGKSQS